MNKSSLKMVSLNIEGDKHLDLVVPFLQRQHADVVCLQEVFEKDLEYLKQALEMEGVYAPMMLKMLPNIETMQQKEYAWGILVLSRLPIDETFTSFYVGSSDVVPLYTGSNPNDGGRVVVGVEVDKDGGLYRVLTTHFTWTPDGRSTDLQRDHLEKLFTELKEYDDFVLCGDFNAPRGGSIWASLAERYTDNLPSEVGSTLDMDRHRAKDLVLAVDGIFSTPKYRAVNVQVFDGVSDHMAIVAEINTLN